MRRVITLVMVIALASFAFAADNDAITINYDVDPINELEITDGSVSLTVNSATAGSEPDAATTASSTYGITTNEDAKKITAAIDSDMEDNVTLSIDVSAPSTGTGAGSTDISATATGAAADVVTAIGAVAESGLNIDFDLSATVAAGTISGGSRTLTLTVTDS
ncbi:MAG: hypothetical protein ACLFSQ_09185 [Candidatus Zixiibacteriota bacterium]